ncbi:MAG: carboxylating nicotinate-nucleotide diphosphorylase [Nitrospirae bacterium]|nr:carboxylating nicotinate-nucleotide diphosphorylase [Nitrospirota bacterium]
MKLNLEEVKPLIHLALKEDVGAGDITTKVTVPTGIKAKGIVIAKERGRIAGLEIVKLIFKMLESRMTGRTSSIKGQNKIRFRTKVKDGDKVRKGQIIAEISGPVRSILMAERTALNFLQRLSGIATFTAEFVDKVKPYKVKIMDTRKTTPGWRVLEKYAVRLGGGCNHRRGLYDGVLIKDNHIQINKCSGTPGLRLKKKEKVPVIGEMMKLARKRVPPGMKIEIEVKNLREVKEAVRAEADIIMLDNMNVGQMKKAVELVELLSSAIGRRPLLEASGGVNLRNVREIAKTGVDMVSVGALTHSAKGLDLSFDITECSS